MTGYRWWRGHWLSGFQWFFFIFCNTVVVPPTLQSAFQLSPSVTFCITQYTFLATAIACLFQVMLGRPARDYGRPNRPMVGDNINADPG